MTNEIEYVLFTYNYSKCACGIKTCPCAYPDHMHEILIDEIEYAIYKKGLQPASNWTMEQKEVYDVYGDAIDSKPLIEAWK